MKRALPWLALGALVGSLLWSALRPGTTEHSALEGRPFPALEVRDLDGRPAPLPTSGRVRVVNVWAAWCGPCVEEMPSLQRLHATLGPEGLAVVGLSVDDDAADARRLLEELHVGYPNRHDPGGDRAYRALRIEGLPTTFVVEDGVVIKVFQGLADYDRPEALAYFRGLLARSTRPSTSPTR